MIGCINCTHIPISLPGGDNAEIFRNRKGFFRLMCKQSVTLICFSQTSYADAQVPHMIAAFLIIERLHARDQASSKCAFEKSG